MFRGAGSVTIVEYDSAMGTPSHAVDFEFFGLRIRVRTTVGTSVEQRSGARFEVVRVQLNLRSVFHLPHLDPMSEADVVVVVSVGGDAIFQWGGRAFRIKDGCCLWWQLTFVERSHRDIASGSTDVRATGGTGGYAMLRTCEVSAAPVRDAWEDDERGMEECAAR